MGVTRQFATKHNHSWAFESIQPLRAIGNEIIFRQRAATDDYGSHGFVGTSGSQRVNQGFADLRMRP